MPTPGADLRSRLVVLLSCAVAVFACATYVISTPLLRGPDEAAHVGYAGFLLRHGRLPDPTRDAVYQAHHPPLYYAFVAAIGAARPDATEDLLAAVAGDARRGAELRDGRDLRREGSIVPISSRRVVLAPARPIDDPFAAAPIVSLAEGETPAHPPRFTTEGFLILLRASGLLLLAAAVVALAKVAKVGADASVAALAAAACVLAPQFAATFAFINSDQFAVAFSVAAFAVLVGRGPERSCDAKRVVVAGALLGLALLSKLFAVGACVACGVYVLSAPNVALRARLRAFAILTFAAVLIGAPWVLRQFALGVGVDPATASGGAALESMKPYPPDAARLVDLAFDLWRSWYSSVGSDLVRAGAPFELLAAAMPLLAVGGSIVVAIGRGADGGDRAAARSFLAGLLVQAALVVAANYRFESPQGRYFYVLAAPGVLALATGARTLCGARARGVLSTLVVVGLGATLFVQHARVLPSMNAPNDRFDVPRLVGYANLGGDDASKFVAQKGVSTKVRDALLPLPEDVVLAGSGEVVVAAPVLDAGSPYVLETRLRRIGPVGSTTLVYLDDLRLAGPFAPETDDGFTRTPFVAPPTREGETRLRLRFVGAKPDDVCAPAEYRVTRAAFRKPRFEKTASGIVAIVDAADPSRAPEVSAAFDEAPLTPLRFGPDGVATVAAESGATPRRFVVVEREETVVARFKPTSMRFEPGSDDDAFARDATGFRIRRFDPVESPTVAWLFARDRDVLPEGAHRWRFFDAAGPIPTGLLRFATDGDAFEASEAVARTRGGVVGAAPATTGLVRVGPAFDVDRVELSAPAVYRFDVP